MNTLPLNLNNRIIKIAEVLEITNLNNLFIWIKKQISDHVLQEYAETNNLVINPQVIFSPNINVQRQLQYLTDAFLLNVDTELLNILRILKIDLNKQDQSGRTLIYLAVTYSNGGEQNVLRFLIGAGADVNIPDNTNSTPLLKSANFYNLTKILLEAGADPNIQNNTGQTPLHNASSYGNLSTSKLLIDAGANVNILDRYDRSPLFIAIQNQKPNVAELLIKAGSDPNVQDTLNYDTPLRMAIQLKYTNHVELINSKNLFGKKKVKKKLNETLKETLKEIKYLLK